MCGYSLVRMLARLGEQSGVVANELRNWAPSRASRSMFGVLENGWPAQPMSSQRRSSTRMKMMLGCDDGAAQTAVTIKSKNAAETVSPRVIINRLRFSMGRNAGFLES